MPEYLAPGVYVEEVPSGSKPIEGASTSTAAMVGMTQRGPVNTPTLVTAAGSYARQFGGLLHPDLFTDGRDALPYAAEGFFANGGSRLWVVRIVGDNAREGRLALVGLASDESASRNLATQAFQGEAVIAVANTVDIAVNDRLLITDGPRTETVTVRAIDPTLLLAGPVANAHAAGHTVTQQAAAPTAGTLQAALAVGDDQLALDDPAGIVVGTVLRLRDSAGDAALDEFLTVAAVTPAGGGNPAQIDLEAPLVRAHAQASILEILTDTAVSTELAQPTAAGVDPTVLTVSDATGFAAADLVRISDGAAATDFAVIGSVQVATRLLAGPVANAHAAGHTVTQQAAAPTAGTLQAALAVGDDQLALDDPAGIVVGTVLRLRDSAGDAALDEFLTVAAVTPAGGGNPAQIDLEAPLVRAHAQASILEILTDTAVSTELAQPTAAGVDPTVLTVSDATGFAAADLVRISDGAAATDFAVIGSVPGLYSLTTPLTSNHAAGAPVSRVQLVLDLHAVSPGAWGNSVRISTRAAAQVETSLAAATTAADATIRLGTAIGLFPGSILVIGGVPGTSAEVASVDAATGEVNLTAPLGANHAAGAAVRSQEFSLVIERVEAGKVVESETFERLSLAARHLRNALVVVGSWDTAAERPSRSGASALVRLSLPNPTAPLTTAFVHGPARFLAGGNDDVATVDDDAYIGTASVDPADRTGIQSLENEPTISIVAVPGRTSVTVQKALVDHCEKMRYRFAVLDTPIGAKLDGARSHRQNFDTTRAAVYYPGLVIADRFGAPGELLTIPSSGHMLGIVARTDTTRGVHKTPANEVVRGGVLQFETKLGKGEQDILNPIHVNCFRDFREENRGLRIYGGRVATSDPEFKYISVRRLLLFIEQSLDVGLQWAVFEPNDQPLWDTVRQSVSNFLTTVWRSGALAGGTQAEAFFVNIGYNITMTQDDIDNGRLIAEIGVAPVRPAEFVIVRISQKTREATA